LTVDNLVQCQAISCEERIEKNRQKWFDLYCYFCSAICCCAASNLPRTSSSRLLSPTGLMARVDSKFPWGFLECDQKRFVCAMRI
jgi:hypothetical protein